MRRFSLGVLFLMVFAVFCTGQVVIPDHLVCDLTPGNRDHPIHVPEMRQVHHLNNRTLPFVIDFTTMVGTTITINGETLECEAWSLDAQLAVNHAANGIYGMLLQGAKTVHVNACFAPLPVVPAVNPGVGLPLDFLPGPTGGPLYPKALAEELNMTTNTDADILVVLNSQLNWYTDIINDTPGPSQYDMVTVALHELTHGLGMAGSAMYNSSNGEGSVETDPPHFADMQIVDNTSMPITDYLSPSVDLGALFTGGPCTLRFLGEPGNPFLNTPTTWNPGSSVYHLESNICAGQFGELMFATLNPGDVIRQPGLGLDWLVGMGWQLMPLPIDLLDFQARRNADQVRLNWVVADEAEMLNYVVQRSSDGDRWSNIGTLPALNRSGQQLYELIDKTPVKDIAYYRLRINHIDDAYEFSDIVHVSSRSNPAPLVVFPNPANDRLSFRSGSIGTGQIVRVMTIDGREALSVILNEGQSGIDISNLQPGVYIVSVQNGHTTRETRFIKE